METMKFCISPIHLGRYKIEFLDDNNQVVNGTDGGSALVMIMLTKWLFDPEHLQYQRDQRANSDELGNAIVDEMRRSPTKFLPPKAKP
jgi:hypothetical protein